MIYWFMRLATWLAARTPRSIRVPVAGALTVLVYYAWVAKRHVTIANMAQIIGGAPDDPRAKRLARASWHNYGRYVADFLYASGRGEPALREALAQLRDVTPPPGAFAQIDAMRERGKGLIVVTAHFGNWDVAGMLFANHSPVQVVVERFSDARLDALVQSQRMALGMDVLWMEKTPRQMLRALQQNGVVAIVVDRPLAPDEGVPVTFFGRRCYVPGGVAQLALLSGAPILPGFGRYDERHATAFVGGVLPPILPESTGDRKADAQRLTQRIYDALEAIIREHPDQWYMFRPFWPDESPRDEAVDPAGAGGRRREQPSPATRPGERGEPAERGGRDG